MWFRILKGHVCDKCGRPITGKNKALDGFWTDHEARYSKAFMTGKKGAKDPLEGAKKYCSNCAPKGSSYIMRSSGGFSKRSGRQ